MPEHHVLLKELMPLIRESLEQGKSVRIAPQGNSMLPMLRPGRDTVLLSPLPERLKKYDLPLYQRSNGQYVLHRVVAAGESYTCTGDNQFILEPGLQHEQMIALVTSFTRAGREYSVDNLFYRVYCRFWHFSRPVRRLWRHILGRLRRMVS